MARASAGLDLNNSTIKSDEVASKKGGKPTYFGVSRIGSRHFDNEMKPHLKTVPARIIMKPNLKGVLLIMVLGLVWLVPQDAQAFYNASTGRWLSRDPIGEFSSPNLCVFVGNEPVLSCDTLGLFGCRPDPCANVCERAQREKLDLGPDGLPDAGGIVCCNGKPYACVWDPGGPTGGKNKKAREIIRKCIAVHENTHNPDVVCPPAPDFSRGKGKDTKKSECNAYRAEAACLRAAVSQCDGDPQCISQVMADMRDVRDQIKRNCSP